MLIGAPVVEGSIGSVANRANGDDGFCIIVIRIIPCCGFGVFISIREPVVQIHWEEQLRLVDPNPSTVNPLFLDRCRAGRPRWRLVRIVIATASLGPVSTPPAGHLTLQFYSKTFFSLVYLLLFSLSHFQHVVSNYGTNVT